MGYRVGKRVGSGASYMSRAAGYAAFNYGRKLGIALRNRYASSRSRTNTKRRGQSDYGNITFQRDEAVMYRRRRAPRRLRRRMRRFAKRVEKVIMGDLGQQTAVINHSIAPGVITPTSFSDAQSIGQVLLYTATSSGSTTDNYFEAGDMNYINALVSGGGLSSKVMFKSAVLDISFTNTYTGPIIVNIYEVVARTDAEFLATTAWQEGLTRSKGLVVNTSLYGVTPFDAPYFGTYWLITKKRRIFLDSNKTYTFMIRYPRDLKFDLDEFNVGPSPTDYAKKGISRGIMWAVYSNQTTQVGGMGPYIPGPYSYQVTWTKTYHYGELEAQSDTINQNQ